MIVFASLVPHSPLLIPEIGRDHLSQLRQTSAAYQTLADEFYVSKPETIVLVTSHGEIHDQAFTINHNPILRTQFKEFGDLVTNLKFSNDLALGYKIKESCETSLPIVLSAQEVIGYGSAVPLYFFSKVCPQAKVVIVSVSRLSKQDHVRLGQVIKKNIDVDSHRVAVIASGDLSHRLHKDSPAGFSLRAQDFDKNIRQSLATADWEKLINMEESLVLESGECGYRCLLILAGILGEKKFKAEELAYESPFGIGYLTVNFKSA